MAIPKKWPAYVINLDKSTDRWDHMQAEFKDTVFNLERFPGYADPQNRGWIGVARTYFDIVKKHQETDPDFNNLFIVFEDDAFRTQDKETFNRRCTEIMTYLETHKGEYSHFQGGGIYPSIEKVECEDPLLLRCDWVTCATFTVIGKEAAETILKYQDVPDDKKEPIDNYLAAHNRGKMLIPFPHLCWQLLGIPSTISNADQKVELNEGFRNAHKIMLNFLKEKNINVNLYNGGGKRLKTSSFLEKVFKKQKRQSKSLSFLRTNCCRKTRRLKK